MNPTAHLLRFESVGRFDSGKKLHLPWGIAIDGNDNVWVANALGRSIIHLCGVRLER